MNQRRKCPKCEYIKYKEIKGTATDKFLYYECLRCGEIWWEINEGKESHEEKPSEKATGDNFPSLPDTLQNKRKTLRKDRKALMKELYKWEHKRITKDDIMDFTIDVELYNKSCELKKKWN